MMMMMRVWRVQLGTAQLFWLAALRVFRTQPPTSAVIWSCNTLSRCLSVCTAQIDQHQVTYKRLLGFKTTGICRPVQHSPGNPSLPTQCKRMGLLLVCTEFTHHYFVYIHRDRSLLSAQAAKKTQVRDSQHSVQIRFTSLDSILVEPQRIGNRGLHLCAKSEKHWFHLSLPKLHVFSYMTNVSPVQTLAGLHRSPKRQDGDQVSCKLEFCQSGGGDVSRVSNIISQNVNHFSRGSPSSSCHRGKIRLSLHYQC